MSILNQIHRKQLNIPKKQVKKIPSIDFSSKSTQATNKDYQLINKQNKKLYDKVEYEDLYSDLIATANTEFDINYPKIFEKDYNNEDSPNCSWIDFIKLSSKKNKKYYSARKQNIDAIKFYKEDGGSMKFPLYKESQIKINIYDSNVKIESAEDDYASDEKTLNYGKTKVDDDLKKAFDTIRRESNECLVDYKKFFSVIIQPEENLNLKKNLPIEYHKKNFFKKKNNFKKKRF